jgi:flagellar biosynthesis chaperone FliJ
MEKLAKPGRKLNRLNRWEEDYSPSGKLVEKFSPEFSRLMEILREVDEKVREIAMSDSDGTLKSLIKTAKSKFNRREYIDTIVYLGRFHERIDNIKNEFIKLEKDLNKAHNQFLFADLDQSQKDFLMKKMPSRFFKEEKPEPKKAGLADEDLIKMAWIGGDIWHNLTDPRGRSLKVWESKVPKYAKELRRETEKMINKSESMFQILNKSLKTLADLRARRLLEDYVAESDKITKKFQDYNNEFTSFYNTHLHKLIESQQGMDPVTDAKIEQAVQPDVAPDRANPIPGVSPTQNKTKEEQVVQPDRENLNQTNERARSEMPVASPVGLPFEAELPKPERKSKPETSSDGTAPSPSPSPSPSPTAGGPSAGEAKPNFPPASESSPSDKTLNLMKNLEKQMEDDVTSDARNTVPKPPSEASPRLDSGELLIPNTTKSNIPIDLINKVNPTIPKPPAVPSDMKITEAPKKNYIPPVKLPPLSPPTQRGLGPDQPPSTVRSASEFIQDLSKSGEENPLVLANKIAKFANSIAETDHVTSQKLLSIAKNILSRM